jgi:hypothetical protein
MIAITLHLDRRNRVLDLRQISGGKDDTRPTKILFKAVELRRSWNRNNPRLLCKEPSQCNLSASHVLLRCDITKYVNKRLVRLAGIFAEARNGT